MLQINNITVVRNDTVLLQNINLLLPHGGKAVITGPSGSGKSSLLAVINGTLSPLAGQVFCNGIEVKPENLSKLRQFLAMIEQEPVLAAEKVDEALLLPFNFRLNSQLPKPDRKELENVLTEFDLPVHILNQLCSELSGGEKQRIAVARIKLLHRQVILADEATSALDDRSYEEVVNYLLTPELTVLAVSHDPRLIERFPVILKVKDHTLQQCGDRI